MTTILQKLLVLRSTAVVFAAAALAGLMVGFAPGPVFAAAAILAAAVAVLSLRRHCVRAGEGSGPTGEDRGERRRHPSGLPQRGSRSR